uniref:Uncharacterized protein n=1 Tax=Arundo donax TaxID=35708 RepID=A0A0A9FBK8_ARUDO
MVNLIPPFFTHGTLQIPCKVMVSVTRKLFANSRIKLRSIAIVHAWHTDAEPNLPTGPT